MLFFRTACTSSSTYNHAAEVCPVSTSKMFRSPIGPAQVGGAAPLSVVAGTIKSV